MIGYGCVVESRVSNAGLMLKGAAWIWRRLEVGLAARSRNPQNVQQGHGGD
jgi:hypothetical protein